PNFDGHDYVAAALAKGAAAAMVDRPPPRVNADAPLLIVDDTMEGLTALGRFARLRFRGQLAAITGSVGKTSTKEALARALAAQGPTFATTGNLNNHWGVPLSLARMPADSAFAVLELGMNHAGEIARLSRLAKPDVALITNVDAAHLENFASVEGIADAKAEIFEGMNPAGAAILNRNNRQYPRLVAHARTAGIGRVWSFGEHPEADARLIDCSLHATCSAISAIVCDEPIQYSLSVPGAHWVLNSLGVMLAVRALGADVAIAARTLANVHPLKGRGVRSRIRLSPNGLSDAFMLIDESYNASPIAIAASLGVLAKADLGDRGRRIAVLGDMLELGDSARMLHVGLKDPLVAADVDKVFACGPNMAKLYDALPPAMRGACAPDSAALAPLVAAAACPGDAIMVKGSLGSRMALVVDALQALDVGDDSDASSRVANGG
ncbi:MAG: UDP-N-acetylmuramoyl-tripeptide--D-alanyl-D-alanine ligase, partial [Alphaproteobacteria bacterium]